MSTLLSTKDLAAELKVPVATVERWRLRGGGPAGFRVGRHVRYRREDVDDWLAERYRADPSTWEKTGA